ncbi:MAG: bifunctional pyr operon transcriptional regulator/uracil phosphoribosyltransferase PyrR, partial [Zetaproteobacteria bacterium CG_4_9_14_3_um_filter_53_7]
MSGSILFEHQQVEDALNRIADAMVGAEVYLVGIHSGGADVADAIQKRLEAKGASVFRGNLDISFYRDDLDRIAPYPLVRTSKLPF